MENKNSITSVKGNRDNKEKLSENIGKWRSEGIDRRTFVGAVGSSVALTALSGCLGSGDTITYLNRGGIIQEAEREVLAEWEDENDIEIEHTEAAEDTEMFELLDQDPGQYDMVTLSPYGFGLNEINHDGEMLAEIDLDEVPNYTENIMEEWRDAPFLEGHDQGLFYHVSAQGLGYNTEEVDEITSWEDIKDPDLEDRVTLFDSAPTRFGNACAALGYLPEEAVEDDDMYAEVEEEMREQDQNVYNHWQAADQFMQDMREEQAFVSSAWGGRVESLYHDDHPVDYAIPEEGCVTWSVAFSIIEESDMKDEIHDLLNWIFQEDVAAEMTEHHYYPIPLEGDHEVMNDRFESLETDDIVWFDWEAVIPHLADIEQTFDEIQAE